MESYVLMLQTDADDRELTESVLAEFNKNIQLKYLGDPDEVGPFIASNGLPSLFLVSDSTRGLAAVLVSKLRATASCSHIPVIILAEKSIESYIKECYRAGANTVITKPSTIKLTRKKIEIFFTYWDEVADL